MRLSIYIKRFYQRRLSNAHCNRVLHTESQSQFRADCWRLIWIIDAITLIEGRNNWMHPVIKTWECISVLSEWRKWRTDGLSFSRRHKKAAFVPALCLSMLYGSSMLKALFGQRFSLWMVWNKKCGSCLLIEVGPCVCKGRILLSSEDVFCPSWKDRGEYFRWTLFSIIILRANCFFGM